MKSPRVLWGWKRQISTFISAATVQLWNHITITFKRWPARLGRGVSEWYHILSTLLFPFLLSLSLSVNFHVLPLPSYCWLGHQCRGKQPPLTRGDPLDPINITHTLRGQNTLFKWTPLPLSHHRCRSSPLGELDCRLFNTPLNGL